MQKFIVQTDMITTAMDGIREIITMICCGMIDILTAMMFHLGRELSLIHICPIVAAFTATATQEVREDIIRILQLQNPFTLTTGFDRKNLYFEVRHPENKYAEVKEYLKTHADQSGIIYCSTRKTVEDVPVSYTHLELVTTMELQESNTVTEFTVEEAALKAVWFGSNTGDVYKRQAVS